MKIFFDTEFTGLHQHTTLVSIGCVAETGDTFYATLNDYDKSQVDDWIQENVIENLCTDDDRPFKYTSEVTSGGIQKDAYYGITSEQCKEYLTEWLRDFDEKIYMWSDCLAYDWVLFCNLFGGALEIPDFIYYIPFDLCTLFQANKIDADIHRETFANISGGEKHNALWDAKVIKACYERIMAEAN